MKLLVEHEVEGRPAELQVYFSKGKKSIDFDLPDDPDILDVLSGKFVDSDEPLDDETLYDLDLDEDLYYKVLGIASAEGEGL